MIIFLLFYNKSNGKTSRMTCHEDFKHCNTIVFDGSEYSSLTWDSQGIVHRSISARSCPRLISALRSVPELTALIVVDCVARVRYRWRPFTVLTCNEIARFVSGLDIGFTITPAHLYKKVINLDGKRNFQILYAWRRPNHGLGKRVRAESAITRPDSAK